MSDAMVNGNFLEKGIYLERTPIVGNNWHTYLVYRNKVGRSLISLPINYEEKMLQKVTVA